MFTVCSKCNLRLTVTATDLRAAQGYVRCGRCHNVFNALAALADDPARQPEQAQTADTRRRPAPPEAHQPAPAAPDASAADRSVADTSLEFNPASTNINEVFIEATSAERTGTFESIVLTGDGPGTDAEPADTHPLIATQALSAPSSTVPIGHSVLVDVQRMRDALAEPGVAGAAAPDAAGVQISPAAAAAETDEAAETHGAAVTAADVHAEAGAFTGTWSVAGANAADEFAVNAVAEEIASVMEAPDAAAPETALLGAPPPAAPIPRWVLRAAAAGLVLCLIAQLLHHYRGELADTSLLHRPLTALYQALGQPLEQRWNIASYEIRQLGATADAAAVSALVVRASISNRAAHAQPLPLLRVVMQDRFGNRVAARDLKPAEYLARGAQPLTLMAPGQRLDVQVAFQDPGQAATGFEIDACMAGHDGTVTCTNDPGGH